MEFHISENSGGDMDAAKKQMKDLGKIAPLLIVILVLLIGLIGTIYFVGPDEVGVVQRFGKYIDTTNPGLHAKWPFGIEKVTKVKTQRIYKEEFGMRTIRAGIRTEYSTRRYTGESLMLTGDLNISDVRWIVQFKIKDPVKFLFDIRDPFTNVRDISEVVMRRLIGDYRVDEVLTTKREEINIQAQAGLQKILDKYASGIHIVTVKLLDVNPPDEVKPAFNDVNEAKQEKDRIINQAWEAYNKVIPRAKGEAEKTIYEAEGYSVDKINRAKGEAQRFLAVLKAYKKAPNVTRRRLYLDALQEVLPKAKDNYIIDPKESSILPLLRIDGGKGGLKK